ncbi:MAG: hypothetical protein R6U96_00855 [Promethearchaeia archaeon]
MEELEQERTGKKGSFFDDLAFIDKRKATKFIVYGIIAALLFGVIMAVSTSLANNASTWKNIQDQENKMNYWDGEYGYGEYVERREEIEQMTYWMEFQEAILVNLARIGVYLGFLFVFLGFTGFAVNDKIDNRTRWIALIIAGVIIIAILLNILELNLINNLNYNV